MMTCERCGAVVIRPLWVRWESGYERWWESLCPECGADLEWDEYCDEWDMMHPDCYAVTGWYEVWRYE